MDGWRGPSLEARGHDLHRGPAFSSEKNDSRAREGPGMGGIRNPAYGGTFDLFSGNQVYE